METREQGEQIKSTRTYLDENKLSSPIAASIGVKDEGMKRADYLVDCGAQILTVDIAHGDSIMMLETLGYM